MGVNQVALEHGIPCTTLKDRIAGRVIYGTNTGPKAYLTHNMKRKSSLFTAAKWAMVRLEVKY